MKPHPLTHRLIFALALGLSTASLVAFAAEPTETTDIEVVNNGKSEKVSLENLKVGETRQLYSEAGTLVTAVRTADAIELDIAGDKTRIAIFEPHMGELGELGEAEIDALIEAHAGAHGSQKRVVRIERDAVEGDAGKDGKRKVVIVHGDGATHDVHGEHPHVLIKHGDADGKQVIVKRRIHKPADAQSK